MLRTILFPVRSIFWLAGRSDLLLIALPAFSFMIVNGHA